jgi:hypothetical protein
MDVLPLPLIAWSDVSIEPSANRPNFLIITTDQHNLTHFCYAGHPVVQTPDIDALAAQSTNFSRTYVTNPVCMPTQDLSLHRADAEQPPSTNERNPT